MAVMLVGDGWPRDEAVGAPPPDANANIYTCGSEVQTPVTLPGSAMVVQGVRKVVNPPHRCSSGFGGFWGPNTEQMGM